MYQKVDLQVIETKVKGHEHSIKPPVYNSYLFTDLDDRVFEILLYLIYKKEINDKKYINEFDDVTLMQGVAEQGMDCVLHFEGKNVGLIQCKNYKAKLTKPDAAREIIKFSMYYLLDSTLISDVNNFTYFLVASSGFNGKALPFLSAFNSSIEAEDELEKWVDEVIDKYETFKTAGLTFDNVKDRLLPVLKTIKIKKVTPEDLSQKMDENPSVSKRFFNLHMVTSEEEITKLRNDIANITRMSFHEFLNHVNETILNLEYIRDVEIKDKLIQRADTILEQFLDMGEDNFDKFVKAIKVPFKNKFADKTPIIYEENLAMLTDIVIKVILISLVNPHLEFSTEKGRAIKLRDNEVISLIFSENNEEFDLVVLQLLKYFNDITDDLGNIKTVVVGNSFPNACVLGGKGAELDFEYVIDRIVDVKSKSDTDKEEFTNLRNRFDFSYHCQNAFKFKTLRSYTELEQRLSQNFRGDNVGQGDAILQRR